MRKTVALLFLFTLWLLSYLHADCVVIRTTAGDQMCVPYSTVGLDASVDDTVPIANGATFDLASIPGCLDTGGNHLNYNASTNSISCGTSSGGSVSFPLVVLNTSAPSSPASGNDTLWTDSTDLRFHDKNASGVIGTTVVADTGASNNFVTAISAAGAISKAQPSFSNISGSVTDAQVPNNITIDLATAATALASDPTDCSANQFANAIVASGNLTCAQPAFSNLSGSATDAQVPDTITINGSGTVTPGSIGNLGDNNILLGGAATNTTPTIPACADTGGNHLNYTSHGFTCGTTGDGVGSGGGAGALASDTFITISHDADLSGERVLTAGANITITDGGANSTETIALTGQADDKVLIGDGSTNTARSLPSTAANAYPWAGVPVYNSNTNTFAGHEFQPAISEGSFVSCGYQTIAASAPTVYGLGTACGATGTSAIFTARPSLGSTHTMYEEAKTKSSTPASGDKSGRGITNNVWRADWNPRGWAQVVTDATTTSTRMFVGFYTAVASGVVNFTSDAVTVTQDSASGAGAYFEWDTATDGNWYYCLMTGGGAATRTCTTTSISAAASTEFKMSIYTRDNGITWVFDINGTIFTSTTNVPSATTKDLEFGSQIITLTGAQRLYNIGRYGVTSN